MPTYDDLAELRSRMVHLERSLWRVRVVCLGVALAGTAAILVGQGAVRAFQPTIVTRGVKIVDAAGRKRAELVCVANATALRMFSDNGALLTEITPARMKLGEASSSNWMMSPTEMNFMDGTRSRMHWSYGAFVMFDESGQTRISLTYRGNSLGFPVQDNASLKLVGPNLISFNEYTDRRTIMQRLP